MKNKQTKTPVFFFFNTGLFVAAFLTPKGQVWSPFCLQVVNTDFDTRNNAYY